MPRYPETRALLEQALRHLLSEQETVLKRPDCGELLAILSSLNQLAMNTTNVLTAGFNRVTSTHQLTREAQSIESAVDDLSESLWTHIPISVSAIYERIERSLKREPGKAGLVADTRAHYHNLRLRLLEQMLGAQMLVLNSDLGDEHERIWQEFLERHLGPNFKVLRGGHIYDHQGNRSELQIDLIVVSADAQVFLPGDSDGGNANVLVDQVISAIMVTSNLTVEKLEDEWKKLQSLPQFTNLENDFPHLRGHPWPLCYILAARSDPAEELRKAWSDLCTAGLTQVVPQFVIALDTGFLYCGLRKWPAPRFPGNYIAADHVHAETGVYGGLGLAWLIAQHQGRLAAVQRQTLAPITRFAALLDEAVVREGVPATYSQRFNTMMQMGPLAGVFEWGSTACFAHNRLQLRSLQRNRGDGKTIYDVELFQPGVDRRILKWPSYTESLRWFRYGHKHVSGQFLALEEWIDHRSKAQHRSRIAVFDIVSGDEKTGPKIDGMKDFARLDELVQQNLIRG